MCVYNSPMKNQKWKKNPFYCSHRIRGTLHITSILGSTFILFEQSSELQNGTLFIDILINASRCFPWNTVGNLIVFFIVVYLFLEMKQMLLHMQTPQFSMCSITISDFCLCVCNCAYTIFTINLWPIRSKWNSSV